MFHRVRVYPHVLVTEKEFFFMEYESESEVGVGVSRFHEEDPWATSFPVPSTRKFFLIPGKNFLEKILVDFLPGGFGIATDTMRAVRHAGVYGGGSPPPFSNALTPGRERTSPAPIGVAMKNLEPFWSSRDRKVLFRWSDNQELGFWKSPWRLLTRG